MIHSNINTYPYIEKKDLILVASLKYVLQNKDSLLSKMEIYLFHSFSMQYLEVHLNPRDLRVSMMSAWDPLVVYTKTKGQIRLA